MTTLNQPMVTNRRLQTIYIIGYLALVLFSISGLLIQGGAAMLSGIISFSSVCVVLAACLYRSKVKKQQKNSLYTQSWGEE